MSSTEEAIKNVCENMLVENLGVLVDMYDSASLAGAEPGSSISLDGITKISIQQGAMLHKLISNNGVERSLEIGLAYGYSTVWILDALRGRTSAKHVAIDPFEKTAWHGVGLAQAARVKTAAKFEWVADYAIQAVPALLKQGEQFDFAYIDGNHRFDDVIVDFYLVDQVMSVGGLVVLDDMWMDSIKTAQDFILKNRGYELIDQPVGNISVLRKLRQDDRDWRHFVPFSIGGPVREKKGKGVLRNLFR